MAEHYTASASIPRSLAVERRRFEAHLLNLPALATVALALAALLGLLYLAQTSELATSGYDVQALEAERAQWQLRNDQLRLQIAEARSLDTVERRARGALGMGRPGRVVFVRAPTPTPTLAAPTASPSRTDPADLWRLVDEALARLSSRD